MKRPCSKMQVQNIKTLQLQQHQVQLSDIYLPSVVQRTYLLHDGEQQSLLEVGQHRKYPNFMKCFESALE